MTSFVFNSNKDMYNVAVQNSVNSNKLIYSIINTKNVMLCTFTAHDEFDGMAYVSYAVNTYEGIIYNNFDNEYVIKVVEQEDHGGKLVRNIYNYSSKETSKAIQKIIDIAINNQFPIVTITGGDDIE